jgi:hypothetical protein
MPIFINKTKHFTKVAEIAKQILNEEVENPVVKNIKATEDFDTFLNKPENKGEVFYKEEMDVLDRMDTKPSKKLPNQIKYSGADDISSKNKELVIIKKQKRYLAFFCVKEPTDLNPEEPAIEAPTQDSTQPPADASPTESEIPEEEKDVVFIKVSKPFSDTTKNFDTTSISNFVTFLLSDLQM